MRKLVLLYLVFYLVLLLVPPGVLLLGQDSGEAAPAQGETLSPAPAESQGPQGFLEGRTRYLRVGGVAGGGLFGVR